MTTLPASKEQSVLIPRPRTLSQTTLRSYEKFRRFHIFNLTNRWIPFGTGRSKNQFYIRAFSMLHTGLAKATLLSISPISRPLIPVYLWTKTPPMRLSRSLQGSFIHYCFNGRARMVFPIKVSHHHVQHASKIPINSLTCRMKRYHLTLMIAIAYRIASTW